MMGKPLLRAGSLLIILALAAGISGCWDKVEIDKRAFVLALALDKFEYSEAEKEKREASSGGKQEAGIEIEYPADSPRNRIVLSIVYPNVGLLTGKGGLVPDEMKFPMSTVGPDIFECLSQLTIRMNKQIFLGHLKAVLIGEELARDRDLFLEVMDDLERNSEISRNVNFAVVRGKARDVLFMKPLVEPIIGTYIEEIFETSTGSSRYHRKKLGDILKSMGATGNSLAPRIVPKEIEVAVAGSSVIKDYRLVGWLGEIETQAAQWIDNMVYGGTVTVFVDGIPVPFEITDASRKIKVSTGNDGNIKMHILLKGEGNLVGYKFAKKGAVMDDKFIRKIEKAVAEEVVSRCAFVMDKMKHRFGADIWDFGGHIRKFYPDLWEQIKDDWKEIFPDVDVTFSGEIKIRRIGITK